MSISNVVWETWFVISLFVLGILFTARKSQPGFFPKSVTDQLKGVAIIFVVFSHIGYFLVDDHRFLVPLSNYAGVGVDLFLILSGYGLTLSAIERPITRLQFYKKRLLRLFVPILIAIFSFLSLDFLILNRVYPLPLVLKNLFGFFPSADLYSDINSPLWFITMLLFFYVIFPLFFFRKQPVVSALALAVIAWVISLKDLSLVLSITPGVASLYRLHIFAFPIGVFLGSCVYQAPKLSAKVTAFVKELVKSHRIWFLTRAGIFIGFVSALVYFLGISAVGQGWKTEESISVLTALALVGVGASSPLQSKLFSFFGIYSFELYLLHWPLLYRYDFFYRHLPLGLATIFSLMFIMILSFWYQKLISLIFSKLK
jgi:peptidoglycan/LPS O-acetylase OafA/YrhL